MNKTIALEIIESEAIMARVSKRDIAQAALDEIIALVLKRVGAPPAARIEMQPDGVLFVMFEEHENERN